MAWEAIACYYLSGGLSILKSPIYMVLVPTTLLRITWLCIANAREI